MRKKSLNSQTLPSFFLNKERLLKLVKDLNLYSLEVPLVLAKAIGCVGVAYTGSSNITQNIKLKELGLVCSVKITPHLMTATLLKLNLSSLSGSEITTKLKKNSLWPPIMVRVSLLSVT